MTKMTGSMRSNKANSIPKILFTYGYIKKCSFQIKYQYRLEAHFSTRYFHYDRVQAAAYHRSEL